MIGVELRCDRFEDLFAPLLPEFHSLFWFADFQSGYFDSLWYCSIPEAEQRVEAVFLPVPCLKNTTATVWRPGTLPELASRIVWDEWSYLVGFEADGDRAATEWVERFWREDWLSTADSTVRYLSPSFFRKIEQFGAVFILLVYQGLWEMYTPRPEWLGPFQGADNAAVVESDHWKRDF